MGKINIRAIGFLFFVFTVIIISMVLISISYHSRVATSINEADTFMESQKNLERSLNALRDTDSMLLQLMALDLDATDIKSEIDNINNCVSELSAIIGYRNNFYDQGNMNDMLNSIQKELEAYGESIEEICNFIMVKDVNAAKQRYQELKPLYHNVNNRLTELNYVTMEMNMENYYKVRNFSTASLTTTVILSITGFVSVLLLFLIVVNSTKREKSYKDPYYTDPYKTIDKKQDELEIIKQRLDKIEQNLNSRN